MNDGPCPTCGKRSLYQEDTRAWAEGFDAGSFAAEHNAGDLSGFARCNGCGAPYLWAGAEAVYGYCRFAECEGEVVPLAPERRRCDGTD